MGLVLLGSCYCVSYVDYYCDFDLFCWGLLCLCCCFVCNTNKNLVCPTIVFLFYLLFCLERQIGLLHLDYLTDCARIDRPLMPFLISVCPVHKYILQLLSGFNMLPPVIQLALIVGHY